MGRVLSRLIALVWQPTEKSLRGWALASVIANAVIIATGAAVRLSSSGLGCPDWPTCTKTSAVAAQSTGQTTLNTWIEFSNRLLNFPLVAIAGLTFIAFLRYYLTHGRERKDLLWLSAILPLGVIAQAVLGGILVLLKLPPALVAAHFLLSTAIILTSAVVLHARTSALVAAVAGSPAPPPVRTDLRVLAGLLAAITAVMLAAGTVVTGTGPLAGNAAAPRYKLPLEGVTQLHADIGWLMAGLAVALVVGLRFSGAPARVVRASWIMIGSLGLQGVIGYIQYFTHLPAGLVWVHVTGSVLVWIAVLRLFLLMRDRGPLTRQSADPAAAAPYRQPEPLDR